MDLGKHVYVRMSALRVCVSRCPGACLSVGFSGSRFQEHSSLDRALPSLSLTLQAELRLERLTIQPVHCTTSNHHMSNSSPGQGPYFLHHRSFHRSLGAALRISTPASARAPLIHGTSLGIGPCQIFSSTGHGQVLRGAWRIISGYVVPRKCGFFSRHGAVRGIGGMPFWNLSQHSPKPCLWMSKAKQRSSGQKVQIVQIFICQLI